MYVIMTDEEILASFNNGEIDVKRLEDRDARHLATLLTRECYDEWVYNVEKKGKLWKELVFDHSTMVNDDGWSLNRITIRADSDYFVDRPILELRLHGDVSIEFGDWMDFGMLEMVQDCFMDWVSDVKERLEKETEEGEEEEVEGLDPQ